MKLVLSPLLLLLPALIGGLVIHLVWPGRRAMALLLKLSLGIGLGLGISSILYFAALLIAPGRLNMLAALILLFLILIFVTIRREGAVGWPQFHRPSLSAVQWALLALTLLALIFSMWIFANLSIARPQGSFDAWGIWNRTARFIFRDPENWTATFSPNLFWLMHADYPLLVPLNVAWSWEVLGFETNRIPSMQSFLFLFGTLAVLFSATSYLRTIGQGSLSVLVLTGVPSLFFTGYGQISDVPLAYFILGVCVLIHAGFSLEQPRLLALAGFMAGLAAWTKNEGLLLVMVSLCAWLLSGKKNLFGSFGWYLAGLALPLLVVIYFKIALAPPGDLFVDPLAVMLQKLSDPARYWTILRALALQAASFAGWPLSIFAQLLLYAAIVGLDIRSRSRHAVRVIALILFFQLAGYFSIYLLTPQELQRHLDTSVGRLVMQLTPALIFLCFSIVSAPDEPETAPRPGW